MDTRTDHCPRVPHKCHSPQTCSEKSQLYPKRDKNIWTDYFYGKIKQTRKKDTDYLFGIISKSPATSVAHQSVSELA